MHAGRASTTSRQSITNNRTIGIRSQLFLMLGNTVFRPRFLSNFDGIEIEQPFLAGQHGKIYRRIL